MSNADIGNAPPPPSSFEVIQTDTLTKESSSTEWKNQPTPKTAEEWIARAKHVAEILALDVHDASWVQVERVS